MPKGLTILPLVIGGVVYCPKHLVCSTKGCVKKEVKNIFFLKMGLHLENSYKTDPPITIYELSEK